MPVNSENSSIALLYARRCSLVTIGLHGALEARAKEGGDEARGTAPAVGSSRRRLGKTTRAGWPVIAQASGTLPTRRSSVKQQAACAASLLRCLSRSAHIPCRGLAGRDSCARPSLNKPPRRFEEKLVL